MAGYRAPGAGFTNATTKNDQIQRQRDAYQSRDANSGSERGVARSTTPLFRMPEGIFEASVEKFNDLDRLSESGNPDFISQIGFDHSRGQEMFGDVAAQSDKPNRKGPNLIAPDINGETFSNDEQQTSQFTNRGFGWRDQRNEPASNASRIGEYFSKYYSSEGPSQDKPVFGEAKNPAEDPNINYNQS